MKFSITKSKLGFECLSLELYQKIQQSVSPERLDFYPLLEEMSGHYGLTAEELLLRGFRKAYRQAIEGL